MHAVQGRSCIPGLHGAADLSPSRAIALSHYRHVAAGVGPFHLQLCGRAPPAQPGVRAGQYNLSPLALTSSPAHYLALRNNGSLSVCVFDCMYTKRFAPPGRAPHALPRYMFLAAICLLVAATQAYFGRRMLKITSARCGSCSCPACRLFWKRRQRQDVIKLAPACRELWSLEYLQAWAQVCNHTLCMVVCLLLHSGEIPIASPSAALLFSTYLHTFDQARCLNTTPRQFEQGVAQQLWWLASRLPCACHLCLHNYICTCDTQRARHYAEARAAPPCGRRTGGGVPRLTWHARARRCAS